MKYQRVVEIISESYEEEQFLQREFPEAWFVIREDKVYFYVPVSKEYEVQEAYRQYQARSKK